MTARIHARHPQTKSPEPGNWSPGWPNQGVILYQVQIVTYIEIIIDSARISIF